MLLKFKIPAQSEVVAHITRRSEELQRDGLFGEKKVKRLEEEVERLRKAVFWAKQNADRCILEVDCCTINLNTTCGSPECIDLMVAAANKEE